MELIYKDSAVHKIQVVNSYNKKLKRDTLKYKVQIDKDTDCFEIHIQVTTNVNSYGKSIEPHSSYSVFFCQFGRYNWDSSFSADEVAQIALNEGINDLLSKAKNTLETLCNEMIGLRRLPQTKEKLDSLTEEEIEEKLSDETITFSPRFYL